MITDFHAKYFAYELGRRCSSDSVEKLTAVLADEVGPGKTINPGPYRMAKGVEDANTYRVGHPLAQRVLARARELEPEPADVAFDLRREWQEHRDPGAAEGALGLARLRAREHERAGERGPARLRRGRRRG